MLIIQTNLLNSIPHPSTIICPITTNIIVGVDILRVHLKSGNGNLHQDCDVLIDQIRAIDNKRLIKKVGKLPSHLIENATENLLTVLDLE